MTDAADMIPDRTRLLQAILLHVPFDGWSEVAFAAAAADCGLTSAQARAAAPRGAVDLAIDHHKVGDASMIAALKAADLAGLRFRERVAFALRTRLKVMTDREVVRRASALFALPHLAPEGARLIWGTADAVWTALGDTDTDLNWYTKRATLSAVWASVVLFWLGDDSPDGQATSEFIDRRIDGVMQIEKVKAQVRDFGPLKPLTGALGRLAGMVRAPGRVPDADLPGRWNSPP